MRFLESLTPVGLYLDGIGHRVDDAGDLEVRLLDLQVRIQPLSVAQASGVHADVRTLLFGLMDAEPRPSIKNLEFAIAITPQHLALRMLPELDPGEYLFTDCEITKIRARTQANVDGYALTFRVTVADPTARDLEYANAWLTEERFATFTSAQPDLFDELARAEA